MVAATPALKLASGPSSGVASGTVTDQNMSMNTTVGTMSALAFGSLTKKCAGPLGSTATSVQQAGVQITLMVNSSAAGVVVGVVVGVDLVTTISGIFGTCASEIKGSAGIQYNTSTGLLQFITPGDSLSVSSTSGSCPGLPKTGDVMTLSSGTGGLAVTGAPVNPILISQP